MPGGQDHHLRIPGQRVGASLDLEWAGLKPETAPVRLQLRDATGKVLATVKPALHRNRQPVA